MKVRANSWHAKLYIWWYQQKYGKTKTAWVDDLDAVGKMVGYHSEQVPNIPERTNLCPYMRAVLFWSWMRWIFIDGRIGKIPVSIPVAIFLLIELPRWAGIISYDLKMALLVVYMLAFGAFLGGALAFVVVWLQAETSLGAKMSSAFKPVREFKHLVSEYTRAGHDRICPEVEFTKED